MTARDSAFLLLGPETGEKEAFIRELITRLEKERNAKADVYKFFLPETPSLEIVSLLRNRLLFSDLKVVIVFGAETLSKSEAEVIAGYLKQPAADSLLVLCSDETKISQAAIERELGEERKKIFWELLEHQKRGWVKNFLSRRSLEIEEEALDFLMEMVENNTRDLKSTCENLAVFFGTGAVIRYENIENLIYHGKEENVFTLFAGLVRRDFALSLEILDKMLLSGAEEAVRILSGILWQTRQLIQFFALLEQGYTREQAFGKLAVRSKRQQKLYQDATARYSLAELLNAVAEIGRFDTLARTHSQGVHRILLELFIYSMMKRRAR